MGRCELDRPRLAGVEGFAAAGKGPLYAAASRAGGLARWRRMFGL